MRGWLRVAAAVPPLHLGDPAANAAEMLQYMEEAETHEADITVFPELGLTGATLGDMAASDTLQDQVNAAFTQIVGGVDGKQGTFLVGLPLRVGDALLDAACVLHADEEGNGAIALCPARTGFSKAEAGGIFRAFTADVTSQADEGAGNDLFTLTDGLQEARFAVCFSSDLWDDRKIALYRQQQVDVLLVPAALPTIEGSEAEWEARLAAISQQGPAVVLVSAGDGESGTDSLYAGHTLLAEAGKIVARGEALGRPAIAPGSVTSELPGMLFFDFDLDQIMQARRRAQARASQANTEKSEMVYPPVALERAFPRRDFAREVDASPLVLTEPARLEEILQIQSRGLARRLRQIHSDQVWLALSGGLDSTLAMLVAMRAMELNGAPLSGVHLVSMPAFGTGKRTRSNARLLGEQSGCDFREISLTEVLTQHFKDIGLPEGDHSVAFENAQARERTQIVMDLANLHGGLHVGTGDLSESALGWATYNGDQMSMYNPNGGVTKTLVRALVAHEAERLPELRETLEDILATPISPELLPGKDGAIAQKTEEIVGPYELHDFFLYYFLVEQASAEKIMLLAEKAFAGEYNRVEILRVLRIFLSRFFRSQFKRSASADGVAVGPAGLSPRGGLVMPSDMSEAAWLAEVDALLVEEEAAADENPGEGPASAAEEEAAQ